MKFGIFHEFWSTQAGSQPEAFAQSFEQIAAAEEWGLDAIWLARNPMNPTRAPAPPPPRIPRHRRPHPPPPPPHQDRHGGADIAAWSSAPPRRGDRDPRPDQRRP